MATITYSNKSFLNQNPNIPDVNKVLDDDMNEIKTVVNTNYNEVGNITNLTTTDKSSVVNAINELKGRDVFSTSETITNKVWIDNKPIYRKVIEIPSFSTTTVTVNTGLTNISNVTDFKGSFKRIDSGTPYFYSLDNIYTDEWTLNYNTGELKIKTNNQYVTFSGYITIEYTKTS